jgi:penicillin amidase
LRGVGYAHARDRLVQMLLLKSVAAGKLSQWWMDTPRTRTMDMFMRESQYATISQQALGQLDATTRERLDYYSQGVNAFVHENRLPLDLSIVVGGLDEACLRWSPVDSLMSMHIMSVLGLADIHLLVEKFIVQAIHSKHVDIDRLKTLFSPHLDGLDDDELVRLIRKTKIGKSVFSSEALEFAGQLLPDVLGSNAWAVSGDWTASGKPMLALDPHLETSRLPAIWYQMETITRSSTTAGSHQFGITMPGMPFLVMGKNQKLALGFTYGFGDYYDYYIEHVQKGKYRNQEDSWVPIQQLREAIRTKNGDKFEMVTFSTANGMLDLDAMEVDEKLQNETKLTPHYLSDGYYLSRSNALTSDKLALGMNAIWRASESTTALEAADYVAQICISLNFVIAGTYVHVSSCERI